MTNINCNRRFKFWAVLVSMVLIGALVTGTTLAYLSNKTQKIENVFQPSQVTSKVVEDPFDGVKKMNVKIQNTGDIVAYIRADIVVTWMDTNGNVLGESPKMNTDYTWSLNTEEGKWFAEDGFYYWPSVVAAYDDDTNSPTDQDLTESLIIEAKALNKKTVDGTDYYISIEIISSAIQANPSTAVEQAWDMTVGTDGKLSNKGGTQ